MPDDSIIRRPFDPEALEATLAQELDFLREGALAALAADGGSGVRVIMGVEPSVFEWAEPRGLCELAYEVARAAYPELPVSVTLVRAADLPRTAAGLLDHERLSAQVADGTLTATAELSSEGFRERAPEGASWSATAIELSRLCAALLQCGELDPGDQLFARGVDSIVCVRLVTHARQRWGVSLELRDVFEAPRIFELAERIDALRTGADSAPLAPIERISREYALPLSAAQLRLWLVSRLAESGPAQHVAGGLRLRGPLELSALQRAAERLAERHESLRTLIEEDAGVPVQRVLAALPVELRVLPLSTAQAPADCVRAAADPAFDLSRGPLWRLWLFPFAPDDQLLVLCMHHVISDGWSMELAARELMQLYAAEVGAASDSPELPELPVQFVDYCAWEAEVLDTDERIGQQLDYWRGQLLETSASYEDTPLELPRRARKQRADAHGRAGRAVAFDFPSALSAGLRALAVQHNTSLFSLLLAAFQLWLARMTGRDDVCVGVPVLGRQRIEAEGLIGCFVNTLVMRQRIEGSASVAELVRAVDSTVRGALAQAELPFDTLVRALAPERSAEHTPLFQVTFNHLRVPAQPQSVAGLMVERIPREPIGSPFELSLETEEHADGRLRALFVYPEESFAYETVREFAALFEHVLWQVARRSQRRVAEIELVDPAQLAEWSAPYQVQASQLPVAPVHELIVRQALRQPNVTALVGAGERWTFAALERSSRALAHQLRARGVGPEVRVGIYVPRGPRMIVAALGVWRAGGAYVPLDMNYPAARLAFIEEDSRLQLVLADEPRAAAHGGEWLALDELWREDNDQALPLLQEHPEQLAYVIYTSGSTGQPKGVAVAHASLSMHCRAVGALYEMDERDCALSFASFSFDAAVEQWTTPLAHGARLVISDAEPWTGAQTYDVVQREAVTIVYPPTAHLRNLAQHAVDHVQPGRSILRAVCVGGEAVSREDHALIMRGLAPERFINGYGPTECVITPLLWRSFSRETPEQGYAPIGRAVGERRVYLLDADLTPVPCGVIGEVYIAGQGHARGYHARAALTAERFIPDPWSEIPGGRLYRTGDLGRWLPSGDVEYVGRRDAQVKLRGYRIELGEIESCLRACADVSDAVVILSAGRLIGYVESARASDDALRAHLSATLPEYMVPAQLVVLDALPKTPNGKVDRAALPQPGAAEARAYAAPHSSVEVALADIWRDVLGAERVGLGDNFFELGGDSIIALQVVSRARQMGIGLSPRLLFQHQTLRALAAAAGVTPVRARAPEPRTGVVPLSPIQRMFFEQRMPVPSHYNQAVLLRIAAERALDPELLARALQTLAEHHDALRLRYTTDAGEVTQQYAENGSWPLHVHAGTVGTPELARLCTRVQQGFDLAKGPVTGALLTTSSDGSQRLLLAAHHLVIDGVSWRVLIEDLANAYRGLERGERAALPPATSSFRTWSELLQHAAGSGEPQAELPQLEAAELPCDVPDASLRVADSALLTLELSEDETASLLRRVPEAYRTQTHTVLLTALARVLCRWANRTSIGIAVEGHGREPEVLGADDIDLTRTVGWFTSIYPLHVQPELGDDDADLARALKRVKEQLRGVPRGGLEYGLAQRGPLPQVTFNYLGQTDRTLAGTELFSLADESVGATSHPDNALTSWLTIDGLVANGRLSLQVRYSAAMYRADTIARFGEAYRSELQLLVRHAASPAAGGVTPSDFPLVRLTQAQLDSLPLPANDVEDIYPLSPLQQGMLFHSLFAHDARTERAADFYVSQLAVDVRGLDAERFADAWRDAVARHAILRTGFVELEPGAGLLQLVHKRALLEVSHDDVSAHPDELLAIERYAERERAAGFVLHRPPLLRLALLRRRDALLRVLVTHHHVLLDGWSLTRLFEEVLRTYGGEQLPAAAKDGFARYIAWLSAREGAASREFWRARLTRLEEPSLLLGALPRVAEGGRRVLEKALLWSTSETAALSRFIKRERVTMNTLLQAAWAIVLQRYLGRETVAFGATVAGRPVELPESETAVGLFINTVPVVLQPRAELDVGSWLREVQRENVALREHEHTALADLQRWAGAPGQALFDTLLVFENYPVDRALRERGGQGLEVLGFESYDRTHYALTLEASMREDERLSVRLKSTEAQLAAAELEQLACRFAELLRALTSSSQRKLGALGLCGEEDVARLTAANATRSQVPDALVHELIEAAARRDPGAVAVSCGATSLSYAELDARANQLSRYLRARGLGPDDLVAIWATRSLDLVVGLLGISKAGAAYLPLDPSYPPERLRTMLEDSGCKLLITQEALPPVAATPVFYIDRDWLEASLHSDAPLPRVCDEQHLAYCIYTSGSTGKPKGVELTHAGFRNYVRWALEAYRMHEIDASAMHSSIAFDLTVTSLWLPLCAGKRVALVEESSDPLAALATLLRELEASGARTLLKITPSHALALSALFEQELQCVQTWIVGGEALSWENAAALRRIAPQSRVINEYGPTETVVGCSIYDAAQGGDGGSVPIGAPIANMQLYVLDAALQPAPTGVIGELYIGGAALARGYHERPALTAERFVPHPLGGAGERLYRSGDLARWRDGGVLEYLGRADHQIKLRGYRIELGEIEAVLREHAAVSDAIVIARRDVEAVQLVAYVAAASGSESALFDVLRTRLPAYMVPAHIVVLGALPLTANGKIDRRALPAPERSRGPQRAPATPREAQLLEIWREVLAAPDAGVEDDFFALGGDSLLSLRVISRARQQGLSLSAKQLFEARTVAQLAAAVPVLAPGLEQVPMARVSREAWQPLSHAQERLWFLAQLEPDSAAYNVSGALRLRGALDASKLEACFSQLVQRHEALRTSFGEQNERGMQRVNAHASVLLRRLDVQGDGAQERARAAFAEEARQPFRLADSSLLRLLLIQLAEHEHVLVVTLHHLVSDADTVATLLRELQALYRGHTLPEPPALQYVDYAVWQRAALDTGVLSQQLEYFREQLGGEHPVLALPLDRPRPAAQSYRGAGLRFEIDAAMSGDVRTLAQRLGASTFMLLLAAFEVVLHRLSGRRDLRVGIPMSARSRVELEGVVGLFVNTLVLRTDVDGRASFEDLVAQLKRVSLDAQANADLPFERLVEALSPERSLSHNPLFQVMFDHQRAPLSGVRALGDVALSQLDKDETSTQLDLTLETFDDGPKIQGSFTYATDLFDAESIAAICERFLRVLGQVVKDPGLRVAEIALLSEAERSALLAAGMPLTAAGDAAGFVHIRIDQRAAERPQAIALDGETGEEPWTYARLAKLSNQWAYRLRELGVGPESRVGLYMGRSPRMVMAALAIMKAGGAYVPLDPSYPLSRLQTIVVDAAVRCVLTEQDLSSALPLQAAEVVCCDDESVRAYPSHRPVFALSGENLAYVVYTSGSTGRPKGVGVSHAALAQHIEAIGRDYGMRAEDTALHFASIGFDAGVEQWISPLAHGARLFIRGDELWSAERALEVLRERAVSWFEMPPGYLHEVARAALARGETLRLRACSAGGEAVSRESLGVMLRAVSPAPVINGYGPTETVITPMTWHASDIAQCSTAYAPIGRVVGPRRSYVLDADLNLAPVGVTGELHLGGASVARGYIGRPDLTAERFVPDPFAAVSGARMYRTGDLARVRADGSVEYVGRADHQVKVRGFRVELGEIEAQLLAADGVREAVVVADAGALASRLIGYVAGEVDAEQLRLQLQAALPEYMVPAQLLVLPELPRNSNGKVDRKQLPLPEPAARDYAAPRGPLEIALCSIFEEVLQLPRGARVGRDDDFFALGGDSIRSLQVISRARKLGLTLQPRDMFRYRGVAQLASAVAQLPLVAAGPQLAALPRDAERYRLSYAQERLWFLTQLDPRSAAYNIAGAVRVRGPLDLRALDAALSELGRRHEALRTTFEAVDGEPWQRLHASATLALALHDCRAADREQAERAARALVEAAADAPFDLERGPLLRVAALRIAEDEHVLSLVMHHIISDGWSLDIAIAELSQLYAAKQLPGLAVQYIDYASWQRTWLQSGEQQRQLDYWRTTLGDEHPVLTLPTDRARPQLPSHRGAVVSFALEAALSARLHAFASAHDTTLFAVVLAAFQAVLHRLSGQRDVRVGVPVTNRDRVETESVIGLFVNTQVLRSDYDSSRSFSQVVRATSETALAARANKDVPFERLVELLQPARSTGHNPLFQVMYNHLRRSDALFAGNPELTALPFAWQSHWAQFDLTLDTEEDAAGVVSGRLTYAVDLFDANTVQRWAAQLVRALDLLTAEPDLPLGRVTWTDRQERAALLQLAAARASADAPDSRLLHERIREQALQHRARIACSYEREQLSYGALELRANQWAQRLVKLGVGPDVLVGLCVERSLDLVVGVLAILKAGGAYVPLDPSAPADRVAYMIDDSRLSLVLTQSGLLPRFQALPALTTLCLDREDVRSEPSEPPVTATQLDHLAYVIYTSGSTGKPKGALLTHRNVTRLFDVTAADFRFDARDVWTLFHSYAFDFSVWELFGALLYGGQLVVVPYDVSRSPRDFYELLLRERVTVLNQTPSAFRPLAAVACAAPEHARLALRRVIFGGEALDLEALRPWFDRFGDEAPQLVNMYGITETTVHVTYRPVTRADLQRASCSPIGRPIADLELYVLDEALEPCSWGVTGELYVGGPGLARGYQRRPGLSAERFVPNPFGPGRLYRSGDLALRREDGALEYLGRSDHQVKIRGFRIELGEIAAQLQSHALVREAVVIARPGPSGQRLLGYVTCHNPAPADLSDVLKQHLRGALPEYMVPSVLIVLPELPLTVNGKLDQARLPDQAQRVAAFVPPASDIERDLAEIWASVLGLERVGSTDDFFELGGHSLLITQVLSRVQKRWGVELPLRTLFEASTLQGLAALIADAAGSGDGATALDALDALLTDLENEA